MVFAKKMTTDQMITAAQAAIAQDVAKLEKASDDAVLTFHRMVQELEGVNDGLNKEICKLSAMEEALANRRRYAEIMLERNEATVQKIRTMLEA